MPYVWRLAVGVVVCLFILFVVPLVLTIFGLSVQGPLLTLLKVCLLFGLVVYIIKGPPVFS